MAAKKKTLSKVLKGAKKKVLAKVQAAKDPKYSAGARYERKAIRMFLRRRLGPVDAQGTGTPESRTLQFVLDWVLARQKRYDETSGGL